MKWSESSLLIGLKEGQPAAVQQWFAQYQPRLVRFLKQSVPNTHDAEELAQETFINCLKHLPLFRGESGIWTWMQSIARHEVADYYRKAYAKKAIKLLPLSDLLVKEPVADAHETADHVKQVLKKLSASSREVLLMKYVDRKTVSDIAAELGKSVKAVESELFRARKEFKVVYGAYGSVA